MVLISIIIIAMFIVLIAWSWNSLGTLENKTKIICITVGDFCCIYFYTYNIQNIKNRNKLPKYRKYEISPKCVCNAIYGNKWIYNITIYI